MTNEEIKQILKKSADIYSKYEQAVLERGIWRRDGKSAFVPITHRHYKAVK